MLRSSALEHHWVAPGLDQAALSFSPLRRTSLSCSDREIKRGIKGVRDKGCGEAELAAAWEEARSPGVRGGVRVGWLDMLHKNKGSVAQLNKPHLLTPQGEGVQAQ